MRTTLAGLYLLLMALLPYLHLPLHGKAHAAQEHAQACAHDHDHSTPENESQQPDAHDDCALCDLLVLPVDLPIPQHVPAARIIPIRQYIAQSGLHKIQYLLHQRTRAPPARIV